MMPKILVKNNNLFLIYNYFSFIKDINLKIISSVFRQLLYIILSLKEFTYWKIEYTNINTIFHIINNCYYLTYYSMIIIIIKVIVLTMYVFSYYIFFKQFSYSIDNISKGTFTIVCG